MKERPGRATGQKPGEISAIAPTIDKIASSSPLWADPDEREEHTKRGFP